MKRNTIFNIHTTSDFKKNALAIFQFQAKNNVVYREFIAYLNIDIAAVKQIEQIPFLPNQFFKSHTILSSKKYSKNIFK